MSDAAISTRVKKKCPGCQHPVLIGVPHQGRDWHRSCLSADLQSKTDAQNDNDRHERKTLPPPPNVPKLSMNPGHRCKHCGK